MATERPELFLEKVKIRLGKTVGGRPFGNELVCLVFEFDKIRLPENRGVEVIELAQ